MPPEISTRLWRVGERWFPTLHVTILTQVVIGILDLWNASTYLSIPNKFLPKSSNSTYRPHRPIVRKIRYIKWSNLYFLSTAIVIVITIKHYDQKNEIYWQNVFNFNHSPIAINSLITQSACVYLDLLLHFKRMLTEIFPGIQYFIIQ